MTAAPIVDATASRRRSRVFITRYLAPALPSEALGDELGTHRVPSNGFPCPHNHENRPNNCCRSVALLAPPPPEVPISGGGISASASSLCFLVPRYQFASRTLGAVSYTHLTLPTN